MTENVRKTMKLGTKITGGYVLVIALLVAVGVLAIMSLLTASNGFKEYRGLARDTNLAGRLQANMLMVRMNVKDFIITGSEKDLNQYNEYYEKMSGFIAESQTEIQKPERAKLIDNADEKVREYDEGFQKVVAYMATRNDLVTNILDVTGPQMEKNLSDILISAAEDGDMTAAFYASLAMKHLLLGRLYMAKFLDSNAQAHVDRGHEEFGKFVEQLTVLDEEIQNPVRRALLEAVTEEVNVYTGAFDDVAAVIFKRNDVISNGLDVLGPAIAADVEDVKLSVKADQDDLGPVLQQSNDRGVMLVIIICIAAIIIAILLGLLISRSITKPVKLAMEATEKISKGDLTVSIENTSTDEIGQLMGSLGQMVRSVREVVTSVQSSADYVSSGSQQVSSSAQQMSQGATEQAASGEEVSASMEEMAANINQNADNAAETEKIAAKAADDAQSTGTAVLQTVSAMTQIAEKITIIEEIARSTNMLSLNASIEAARAGEHGKGFAVVASEVGKLAARSKDAASEISELSASTVEVAQKAGQMLEKLVPDIQRTAELVQEISAASNEQNNGVEQINKAVMQLDEVSQQNASASEELASTSEELASQAESLQEAIRFFTISGNGNGKANAKQAPTVLALKDDTRHADTGKQPEEKEITAIAAVSDADTDEFDHF